jgi:16S rRNA (guanine527-N7)-methyltransferase
VTDRRDPLPTDVDALPPLPADYDVTLDAGLSALGIELDPMARMAIADHVRLLLAWTEAINLTALREPAAVAREHVIDSLTALPLLRALGARALLDLGSGGGFPGLPLALALPAERALLVESIGKKATFLGAAIDALGVRPRLAVAATRAETLARDPHHRERWPAVTVRAVGALSELIELALPLLATGGSLVAWKRSIALADDPPAAEVLSPRSEPPRPRRLDAELAGGSRAAVALGGREPTVVPVAVPGLEDHVLVVVTKIAPTPAGYPRDPSLRRRAPWRED